MNSSTNESMVKPTTFSHGTLECRNLKESRRFYEEFLGMETVRHVEPAVMMTRVKGGKGCTVVCVEVGDRVREQRYFNHWGIDVATKEEVDDAHAKAIEHQEKYGLQKIQDAKMTHGDYSFYFMDRDGNWWEIQCIMDSTYDENYARGDVVPM